jgi:hypothetical protein
MPIKIAARPLFGRQACGCKANNNGIVPGQHQVDRNDLYEGDHGFAGKEISHRSEPSRALWWLADGTSPVTNSEQNLSLSKPNPTPQLESHQGRETRNCRYDCKDTACCEHRRAALRKLAFGDGRYLSKTY